MIDFSLHEVFAKTMDTRLSYVKTIPQKILLASADGGHSFNFLHQRYPNATIDLVENRDDWIVAEKEACILPEDAGRAYCTGHRCSGALCHRAGNGRRIRQDLLLGPLLLYQNL